MNACVYCTFPKKNDRDKKIFVTASYFYIFYGTCEIKGFFYMLQNNKKMKKTRSYAWNE